MLHTLRGPMLSLIGGLIAAGVMWLMGSGGRAEKLNGRVTAVEGMALETKSDFKIHCIKQDERDLKQSETLGTIKETLKNIENQTK